MVAKPCLRKRASSSARLLVCFLLLICFGQIEPSSAEAAVRRLRRHYEEPEGFDATEGSDGRKEPMVVPAHILMTVNDMENVEAYEKCFSLLNEVAEDDVVTRAGYVDFLGVLTNGDLAYDDFEELPDLYTLIFYSTTCTSGQDCVHENPTISLNPEGVSVGSLQFFCRQVMSVTVTTVEITFGYSIRYDSSLVTEEDLDTCLSIATENLLLDSFNCSFDVSEGDTQRRRLSVGQSDVVDPDTPAEFATLEKEFEREAFRYLKESLDSFPSPAPSPAPPPEDCDYTVFATVDSIVTIPCVVTPKDENILCALVTSTVVVSAPQTIEPSETELRAKVTATLREAINGDGFEDFVPEGCLI